ncbi:MAG: hypothetical protein SAK29_10680 [Scytonema sp. PMC 1069.18]|nr:hypothetical protein [Scytonema sp. PMC 1069.18]MEC4882434.1 hypothetical protein [Scytonema sp. PMC 1070.18]
MWLLFCGFELLVLKVLNEPAQAKIIISHSSFPFPQVTQPWEQYYSLQRKLETRFLEETGFLESNVEETGFLESQLEHQQSLNEQYWKQGEDRVKKKAFCSNQTLETLTKQFLQDLPSYANRASQRARRLNRMTDVFSYMVVAGRPEFERLPLNPGDYTRDKLTTVSEEVEQVFFTTLERRYTAGKAIELQLFHWLFLTRTKSGWQFVMMFSQIGSYPKNEPPTPPQDSSNGIVAQGIKAWLRDCRAGSLRSSG